METKNRRVGKRRQAPEPAAQKTPPHIMPAVPAASLLPPGAPIPPNLLIPPPWTLTPTGVGVLETGPDGRPQYREIIPLPVVPVAIISPSVAAGGGGEEQVILVHPDRSGGWQVTSVLRRVLADHRLVVQLAGRGIPVTSLNAKYFVKYVGDVLVANSPPRGNGLNQCEGIHNFGWISQFERFVIGDTCLNQGGQEPIWLNTGMATTPPAGGLVLVCDEREQWLSQVIEATRPRGSLAGWSGALSGLEKFPRMLFALYTSFAAPLLTIVETPNFLVEYAYDTSRGKTTALQVAASPWGVPATITSGAGAGYLLSGDATRAAVEGALALLNSMPTLIDDIHRMPPDDQVRVVYMIAQGLGKARASPWGMARTKTFRTISILSTERSVTGHAKLGGLGARIISIRKIPLEKEGEQERQLAEQLKRDLMANCGVAGRVYIRYLISRLADPAYRQSLIASCSKYRSELADHASRRKCPPETYRYAEYLAVVTLAVQVAHETLPLPWTPERGIHAIVTVYNEISEQARDTDLATRAMRHWQSLLAGYKGGDSEVIYDRTGRIVVGSVKHRQYLAILPHYFEEEMKRQGYDPDVILQVWADRGWIHTSKDRNWICTKPVWRFQGSRQKMVVMKWQPFAEEPGWELVDAESRMAVGVEAT